MNTKFLSMFIAFTLCACSVPSVRNETEGSAPKTDDKPGLAQWDDVINKDLSRIEQLISDQKLEEASRILEGQLEKAIAANDSEDWTYALIRYVQLRIALHGYETAVKFMREKPWPQDLLGATAVRLFYAKALVEYAHQYRWEIVRREKVVGGGDIRTWTNEEIYAEATKAYFEIWAWRDSLGKFKNSALARYIELNNYPEGIRPTLRDVVTYLFVQLLMDRVGWQPDQSDVYRLDLASLLSDTVQAVDRVDEQRHPLEKMVYVLADLEAWHKTKGELEAALEARLERFRHLHEAFPEQQDRELIRKSLKAVLDGASDLTWWTTGMADLADFTRLEDRPDSLVKAHEIAARCMDRHKDSPGWKRCKAIMAEIEAPDFLVEAMSVDGPNRKSIAVLAKNLEGMYFRAYPYDILGHIENTQEADLLSGSDDILKMLDNLKPVKEWKIALPKVPDYRLHRTFVTIPVEAQGFYIIVISAREDFRGENNRIIAVPIALSDLVMQVYQQANEVEVRVLSGSNGRPVEGAEVRLYKYDWHNRHKRVEATRSGADGSARLTLNEASHGYFIVCLRDKDIVIDPAWLSAQRRALSGKTTATLIYTDRSIYRPLQRVMFKAIVYSGVRDDAGFHTVPSKQVKVLLVDANGEVVATQSLITNRYGTASGEFVIPPGRLLGRWRLRAEPDGMANILVEEYKRPTFEVTMRDPEEPLRLNKVASLIGEARYYFGLPVTSGKVRWRVMRFPLIPRWWRWQVEPPRIIASGVTELDKDGRFSIKFTAEADEREKTLTYRYSVSAEVTDEGGETRSAEKVFRLGFTAVEADFKSEKDFFLEGGGGEITIVRSDLDGVPAPGDGKWRLVRLIGPPRTLLPAEQPLPNEPVEGEYSTPSDMERERWDHRYDPAEVMRLWNDGEEVATGTLKHDEKGEAKVVLPKLPAGAYRLRYETFDHFGFKYETTKEFVVASDHLSLPLPALLLVEKTPVHVGDNIRVLATSGFDDQLLFIEVWKDGRRIHERRIEAGKGPYVIEIPVTSSDRGGLAITLSMLRDYQWVRLERTVFVPWDDRVLKVEFSTFRDKIRPGTRETWTVKVTGPGKKDKAVAAAELLAYMYDRSLDLFTPHSAPSPISLFPYRARAQIARISLGTARTFYIKSEGFSIDTGYPSFRPDRLKYEEGWGIGGPGRHVFAGLKRAASRSETMMAPKAAAAFEETVTPSKNVASDTRKTDDQKVELRSEFRETAFWMPHLLTGKDGSATISFEVPDSVTAWNVFVHAITNDLSSGSIVKQTRSIKDFIVRPYLPRFLREGDKAEIKVVVNNASDRTLNGTLSLDIDDPGTQKSRLLEFMQSARVERPFTVPAGGATTLTFSVTTPPGPGEVAFRVVGKALDFSDGELRSLPILPGRMHLVESRFAALRGIERRTLNFIEAQDDPTRIEEKLVVTLDAQLFYQVLSALPYLIEYPYECVEQTLNRFVSTGIMSSLFERYEGIAHLAAQMAKRKTRLEAFSADDPNRRMLMEETPWLKESRGGEEEGLIAVLDPQVARTQRDEALAKLSKAQTSSGAFPWFPGGPPSPWMTLYVVYSFAKALEFGVEVPKDMIQRAWQYLQRHYRDEIASRECCVEFVTFLVYVLSCYPDMSWTGGVFTEDDRRAMLDFSFSHWKKHSPYLKGQLALALKRAGRDKDAELVWDSVMDSSKTDEDTGTYWAPEERAWLWYNDTIETHAFALRTLMEVSPQDSRQHGLVQWLFLNKKLNHWKSTRATAEVIYSLANYLKRTSQLGTREVATLDIGGERTEFIFEPDQFSGKRQVVIPSDRIDRSRHSKIAVDKQTKGLMFVSATWHFSTEKMPEERGDLLKLSRSFYKRVKEGKEATLIPINSDTRLAIGDEVEVHLSLRTKHPMEYVHLRDPRGAGFEPESGVSRHRYDLGIYMYEEIRDSGTNFFIEWLPQGEYTLKYRIRAAMAGTFKVSPATVQPMYAPEFAAHSSGAVLVVHESDGQ